MPQAVAFDTFRFVRRLKDAGVSEEQAEAFSDAIRESQDARLGELATKTDLQEVKADLQAVKADLQAVKADMQADLQAVKADMQADLQAVKADMQADLQAMKADMQADLQAVRTDMQGVKDDVQMLKSDIREMDARIMGEIRLNRWMLVLVIAATVLPALKTLFGL